MPVPSSDTPVPRLLLRDVAADRLRTAILDGSLKPGERLHDADLTRWLSVSRTPVREALSRLDREGLIEMEPNRATRVALPRPSAAIGALQALGTLFGGVVRVTVPGLDSAQRRATLERLEDQLRRVRGGEHVLSVFDTEGEYAAWLRTCPNPELVAIAQEVMYGLAFKLRVPRMRELVPADHIIRELAHLCDAVADGDGAEAEQAMERLHQMDHVGV